MAKKVVRKKGKTRSKKELVKNEKKSTGTGHGMTGVTNGHTVQRDWYERIKVNAREKKTDAVVAKEKSAEFPEAKTYTEKDVAVHRSLFNRGKLPWMLKKEIQAPAKPIPAFDENGEALPLWGSKTKTRKAKRKDDTPTLEFTKTRTKAKAKAKAKAKTTARKASAGKSTTSKKKVVRRKKVVVERKAATA